MRLIVVFVLLFLQGIKAAGIVTFSIAILNNRINAVTNYTWALTLTDLSSRSWMMLTFPPQVTITNNSLAYVAGTLYNSFGFTSNTLNLSTSTLTVTSPLSITVTNVVNPYSALSSVTSFYFSSSSDSMVALNITRSRSYSAGTMNGCTWSFDKCTEQTNSQLAITLSTANRIPSGSSLISVGFPGTWANQGQKYLLSGVSSLTCSLSFNNGTIITSGVSCTYSTSSLTITISFSLSAQLNGNDTIVVYIQGVMSPPTVTTVSTSAYTTSTTDTSGNIIDAGSSCTISPVCATNFTGGTFNPSTLSINTVTTNMEITFSTYPTITFMSADTVVFTYSQPSNLITCTTFKVIRNNNAYDLVNNSTGSQMAFYFPTITPNIDYGYAIVIYMEWVSMKMPESETPMTYLFTFYRNGAEYLELSGTFVSTATILSTANASLTLSNYQMGSTSTTYFFSFVNGQPLSSSPGFTLAFSTDISLSGVSCTLGVNGLPTAAICSSNSSSLIVSKSLGSSIAAGSTIIIQVSGITNPIQPLNYTFGLTTYYNSSVSSSRVEYNSAAFTAVYTAITNLPVTLSPSTFAVYTYTTINISFVCPLNIPALSTFTLTFPSEITQLTPPTQPLLVNNSNVLLNSTPTTVNSTIYFSNLQAIAASSNILITLSLRTPTYMNTFPSIQLFVTQNGSTFIQSLTSMLVQVTTPGTMPVTITPYYSITGSVSPYLIQFTLNIPHPSVFIVQADIGSDVKFNSVGATCTSICGSVSLFGTNGFSVVVNNPYPNSTVSVIIDLNISTFTNSRSVGVGLPWNITTRTNSTDKISYQSSSPTVSVPNIINGALDSNEFYYRNNTNTVKLQLNFTNLLLSTDYLLFTMDRTTYDVYSSLNCLSLYGTCSVDSSSTTNVLVIKVIPNSANLLSNPLQLWFEGLVSGANTYYLQTDYITVGSYNSNGNLIDQGKIEYNISCRDSATLSKNCKTCSNGTCIDCYLSQGYYLNGTSCVTSCGDATSYLSYANTTTGVCQSCAGGTSGCLTCVSSNSCLTCLNSSYYLYPTTLVCSLFCFNSTGYIATTISGIQVCVSCADSNCLICTTTSYGSCIKCSNTSILISGICSNSCPSPSYYVLNANCVACDPSCYTCTAGDSMSCIQCSVGYYNASNICSNTCPNGTAIILSTGSCGCASTCLTCDSSNYANCTACSNTSLFVYNGNCVASCPNSSYQVNTSCFACASGCTTCSSSSICQVCNTNWYIFSNKCYSDCNLISQQYDISGITCVLCPSGCDTCSNGSCTSCLSDYTLSSSSCLKTCEISNTCTADTSNVMPLPGTLALLVWAGVVVIVHYFSHKNYMPYSLITFSALVEYLFIILVLVQTNTTVGRLLTSLNSTTRTTITGLLAFSFVMNYVSNVCYLYIFLRYIKPLMTNIKQIDVISNTVVIVIALLTNYRFAIIAYSKMFPKPNIFIQMPKYLTPIHYLCIGSIFIQIFAMAAAGIGLAKQQKLSTSFMLSADLMIIIIFNILVTLWFLLGKKDPQYFENETKKQHAQDSLDINVTKENMRVKDDKDASNVNMIASIHDSDKNSQQSDAYDFGEKYKKLKTKKAKISNLKEMPTVMIRNNSEQKRLTEGDQRFIQSERIGNLKPSPQRNIFAVENDYQPEPIQEDVNFQQRIEKRGFKKQNNHQMSRATTINHSRPEMQNNDKTSKTIEINQQVFQKQLYDKNNNNIYEIQSNNGSDEMFNQMGSYVTEKDSPNKINKQEVKNKGKQPKEMIKSYQNKTAMRKDKNNRYLESDATVQQKDKEEDITAIIRLKVQESSFRKTQNFSVVTNQENELQEVSPSYYNVQNQRFYIQDLQASESSSQP